MTVWPPRFAVEAPLGRLARYLRLLGFDTAYQRSGDADSFFEGMDADRIALFRTRRLRGRLIQRQWIFIREDGPEAQVRAVLENLTLKPGHVKPFTRCVRCNRPVETLAHVDARGRVPDYIWQTQVRFTICPSCGQVFWPGSHARRFDEKINHWFKRNSIINHDN